MQAVSYYIALPFLYLISLLPFWFLYRVSDLFFVIIYYVLGYRKKVVMENLRNSFPEKTEQELNKIAFDFYRYLCDLFLETFKTLTVSKKHMLAHCKMNENTQKLFDSYYTQQRSIILVMGHFGNWEWAGNVVDSSKHQLYVIYHQLSSKYFNQLVIKMRTRFGTKLIEMKSTLRDMVTHRKDITATAFIADQTPFPENAYWTTFLNQDTPVFTGTEKIASKFNYPVIYISVKRIKRGYYEIFGELLFENPKETKEGEISEAHTRRLEKDIIAQPEIWLWSHRRWKHKRSNS
jgi:KDO2-lipid IV(A) lauroyltransferase